MDMMFLQLSTIVTAIFAGVSLFIISRHIRIPAIILLIVGGVLLGPEFLGVVDPNALGSGLRVLISLCVAVILFEGGLTLQREGLKKAPTVIWKLLTIGVLVTWLGTAALIYFLLNLSLPISLLAGSLVIVTGPTVITPLLKRIQIKEKLYHILHWEAVLIDPIGVFISILCYEWLSREGVFFMHIGQFSYRLLVGAGIGYLGGKAVTFLLRKNWIHEDQSNIFVFASALFLYGISDLIVGEAGILTVVIAGLVTGQDKISQLKHIQKFKSELTELSIAIVFILLAASLELGNFLDLGWRGFLVLAGIMIVIRPVSILLCSYKASLSHQEKAFLAWLAPRGVVAGSMASLFTIELIQQGHPEAAFLKTFTFSVIFCTIILQGMSAGRMAKWLNVEEAEKKGWLIVGAHLFSQYLAEFIMRKTKGACIILDTNADAIHSIQKSGLIAFHGNALSIDSLPSEIMVSIGHVLALTDNRDLNHLICEKWSDVVLPNNLYRWSSQSIALEKQIGGQGIPIWTSLPKPSQIAYEFQHSETIFHQYNVEEYRSTANAHFVIAAEENGKISFHPELVKLSDEGELLSLERRAQDLLELVRRDHIFFLESASYEDLLISILKRIQHLYPMLPHDYITSTLLERERSLPTTLVHGLAAPHLHCAAIEVPLCFVAKISQGIDLHTYEGDLVQVLFVLFSPESAPELHLRLLAEIAKIGSSAETVLQLIAAKTADDFLRVLQNATTPSHA